MRGSFASKIRHRSLLSVLACVVLGNSVHAIAQSQVLQFTAPFAFQSGSQQLPAGIYRVDLDSEHFLSIRNAGSLVQGFVMSNPERQLYPPATGKVVFHRYGSHYFLSEIWQPGNPTGRRVVKSREEKEAQLALNSQSASSVQLALNAPAR